jgi:predicted nucleotidyltransferase
MERVLNQLVEKLRAAYGERLVSVILYGSAAVGDHHGRFSDINILCVLTGVGPRELADATSVFQWWRKLGNPSPLLLGSEEVRTSTDAFPIEFHDIRERRRVLYGADAIEGLVIEDRYYRAQVEHELRAKLLRLRQKAAGVVHEKEVLRTLLADSLSTFCVLFRHALLLAGARAPFEKRETVRAAQETFGIDPAPLLELLDLREGRKKPRDIDPGPLLSGYLNQINTVIEAVDRLHK